MPGQFVWCLWWLCGSGADLCEYFSYLLPVLVYQYTRVLQLSGVSISLPMHHSTSVICCQYQSTNAPQYFSYLLAVSVNQCTTVLQLSVASIRLPMHHSISVICCQYQSTNALQTFYLSVTNTQ